MSNRDSILKDSFGREHTYLRISLTELCNLRCTYCMPAEGVKLSPKDHIMNYDEIYTLASLFVKHGVTKIRLTGGEPLVRRDVHKLIRALSSLPVELTLTTNAVRVHEFMEVFKENGICKINVSLDTLNALKFKQITLRDRYKRVSDNIQLLLQNDFQLKLNVVLIKAFNDDEITDFVNLTRNQAIGVRFIEFMPFDGNCWDKSKLVTYESIMNKLAEDFAEQDILRIKDAPNDTSKNYRIKGYQGSFAIISTVTNPFCDSCNRLRLTANGRIKNCLFSDSESDLLTALRQGQDIEPIIKTAVWSKRKMRGGMATAKEFEDPNLHSKNRSMISIGG